MKQLWQPVKVLGVKTSGNGTILQVAMDTPKEDILKYATSKGIFGELKFNDNRHISAEQRKKIYATFRDISYYTGDVIDYLKSLFKSMFCAENDIEPFSLSDCSLEVAREFISYLIDFCIDNEIPLSETPLERTDDINRYLYMTIRKGICCICGKQGVTYTLDQDKNKMCLCDLHYEQAKVKGLKEFESLYKVYGIKV